MAEDRLRLQIITAGGVKFDKPANYVLLPITGGGEGILADHAPILAAVTDGVVKCEGSGGTDFIYVGAGVADVFENKIIMLVRAAETGENIDLARAEAALSRAQKRLDEKKEGIDKARAQASLHRALARIKTYNMYRDS